MTFANLDEINAFLACSTPVGWLDVAVENLDLLLIDHANCEKKAASTALNLTYRYLEHPELLNKMSRLVREEMRHFEQVVAIMQRRGIPYQLISASRYAAGLYTQVRTHEPAKLVDTLVVGAFIEARSCERFACLAPLLDVELEKFYRSLLASESRHYRDYLHLAESICGNTELHKRIEIFRQLEGQLIESSDRQFRFHSGLPSDVELDLGKSSGNNAKAS